MKKIKKHIIFPNGVFLAFLVPFSAGGVFSVMYGSLRLGIEEPHVSIVIYAIAAYTLLVLLARIPCIVRFCIPLQKNNPFVHRFTTDSFLRVKFSLPMSLLFDVIYAFVQCVLGLINMSLWFYVLAGYYIALASIRFFLFREFRPWNRKSIPGHVVRRFVGTSLLIMNITLAVMILYIVKYDRGFTSGWLFSLVMVSYTIGALITATVGFIKYRSLNSPALTVSKVVNFVAAAVSLLVLETTLFDTFRWPVGMRRNVTTITGAVVCTFVLVLALLLIMKREKYEDLECERMEDECNV